MSVKKISKNQPMFYLKKNISIHFLMKSDLINDEWLFQNTTLKSRLYC